MHHAVISDSEVEVITSSLPPSIPPSARRRSETLSCQPSIWWLETTHFIAATRHDGAARPESLRPPRLRRRVGRLAALLICYGWTAREALTLRP